MRISDWSSDVCSSDLGRTITIEPLRVVPFSHDVGVAGIPLRHANLSGTDQRSGSREAPVSLPRRSAGGDLENICNPRSEENTSELQSLMRISYAVFCLKKKNNKYYSSLPYYQIS